MGARFFLRRIGRDQAGSYLPEFAILFPAFLIVTMGAMDVGHTLYAKAVLEGAVQKAARDSALETGALTATQAAIDANLKAAVKDLHNEATVDINRRYYRDFSTARAPRMEPFDDTNGNGRCDNGESFADYNKNGSRDLDSGIAGQGSAKDVTVLSVTMSYPRMFATTELIGFSPTVTLNAKTVLANQPYAEQNAAIVGNCPP